MAKMSDHTIARLFGKTNVEMIVWWDSLGRGGWANDEEAVVWADTRALCRTIGMVYREDDMFLTFCQTDATQGQKNNLMSVPKAAIIRRKKVRL